MTHFLQQWHTFSNKATPPIMSLPYESMGAIFMQNNLPLILYAKKLGLKDLQSICVLGNSWDLLRGLFQALTRIQTMWSWEGLAVKSTCCSCQEPRFSCQHPHSISQWWVTAIPGDLTTLLASVKSRHTCGIHI